MRHIKYTLSLAGRSNLLNPSLTVEAGTATAGLEKPGPQAAGGAPAGRGQRAVVHAVARNDQIEIVDGADQLTYGLQSSVVGGVVFRAELTAGDDGTFRAAGKIAFGDGQHELQVSSAGVGTLLSGAHAGRKQGAGTLRIDGGTGAFEGATGLITTNFEVDDEGGYRDVHTAVIALGEAARPAPAQGDARLRIRDVIDEKAFPVTADVTMETVADLLVLTKASVMMVVDHDGSFVGVVSEVDVLRAAMPDVDAVLDVGGTLDDALDVFVANGRAMAGQPIGRLIHGNPRTVAPDDELLAVATVMLKTDARRLPVVDRGKFIGSVSLADICWAILSKWNGLMHQ
jgi:CBS domain-containing protein